MRYILDLQRVKKAVMLLAMALFSVLPAFAGDGNSNIYGQLGVHKTQSAQTLGHGVFGLGLFMEGAGLNSLIKDERLLLCNDVVAHCYDTNAKSISSYIGGNVYPHLSLGLSDLFDFSVSIPVYGDYLRVDDYSETDNLTSGGWGDLLVSAKVRAPFGEDFPVDLAGFFAFAVPTGKTDGGSINSYGPWVRDPLFLNTTDTNPVKAGTGAPSTYTNSNPVMKFGAAATMDFNRTRSAFPVAIHLNYSHRTTLGDEGSNFMKVNSFAAAVEWTPVQYVSVFGEYYMDMPVWPSDDRMYIDLNTVTLGTSFHLNSKIDLQIGAQIFVGDDSQYINDLTINLSGSAKAKYAAGLIPKYVAFGGITVKLFKEPEVQWVEEEEYRNPDTDGDGICDPWVTESGRSREFARTCSGIDLCPYKKGPESNDGCPAKKEAYRNPDTDGDGVCDPWVTEEGKSEEFAGTCSGIDLCPYEHGDADNKGCAIVEAESSAPTIIFSASSETIKPGESVTLTWMTTNATEVTIEGIGPVQASGSRRVRPTESTTYTITAKGDGGTHTESAQIEVVEELATAPTVMFNVNPESIQKGSTATLSWMTTDATDVKIEGIGPVPMKGTRRVKPTETTTYTITATGKGGTQIETAEIIVEDPPPVIEAKVNLKGVNFHSGKAELTLDARRVLDGVAEQLLDAPNVRIEIHGHTDNQGSPKSNQELSERRAKSVVGYLATKGVKMSRMKAVGFGQDVPIAENSHAEGRELNRRIEMIRVDD